jgi:integrase-like protein
MALQANERVRYTRARDTALAVRERSPTTPRPPELLDRMREANRLRHGTRSTEKSDVGWIRRYVLFHGKRHPAEMGAPEVTRFLSSLAVQGKVVASHQNRALSALLFLYRHVLHQDLPWLDDVVRTKRPRPMTHPPGSACLGEERRSVIILGLGDSGSQEPGPPAKRVSDRTRRPPGSTLPPVLPCREVASAVLRSSGELQVGRHEDRITCSTEPEASSEMIE